jgi:hypothetical protein
MLISNISNYAQNINIKSKQFTRIILNEENVIKPTQESISSYQINNKNYDLYSLHIKADFKMEFIYMISNDSIIISDFRAGDNYFFENVPIGHYYIFTIYYEQEKPYQNTLFYKELEFSSNDTLEIKFHEADKKKVFQLKRIDNDKLVLNNINFYFKYKAFQLGLKLLHCPITTEEFILNYNNFPDSIFENEWSVKGKQPLNNGDLYLLNGEFTNTNLDTLVQNNPSNFCHAIFRYNLPDSSKPVILHVAFNYPIHCFATDPNYSLPLKISVYQDTSTFIGLSNSTFSQSVDLIGDGGEDLGSIKMRLGKNRVYGFTTKDNYTEPIILSETENVVLGLTPMYWYGKYENLNDEIQIRNKWGPWDTIQLFLTQTNDVLPQYPSVITIMTEDSLILTKEILSVVYEDLPSAGYVGDSLRFSVEPGKYQVTVTNDKSEVAKRVASTISIAEFDLRMEDKNPPYIKSFQIVAGKNLTYLLNSKEVNIIRFIMEDDTQLNLVQLFYKSEDDTSWTELPLELENKLYRSGFPVLSSGYYSLKIFASDIANNTISVIMEPAFLYENTTSINDTKINNKTNFYLYNNYPNPFNPITLISYNLPEISFVTLKVYDILGQEVITLVSKEQTPGIHYVNFDSSNLPSLSKGLPSGIYYVIMYTKKYSKTIKIMLLK